MEVLFFTGNDFRIMFALAFPHTLFSGGRGKRDTLFPPAFQGPFLVGKLKNYASCFLQKNESIYFSNKENQNKATLYGRDGGGPLFFLSMLICRHEKLKTAAGKTGRWESVVGRLVWEITERARRRRRETPSQTERDNR